MRIFLAIPRSPNPSFASDLWKANLHDPLVAMGHVVVLWSEGNQPLFDLDPEAPETAGTRAAYSQRFLREVERAQAGGRLDFVLTYASDSHLEPVAIDHVRERVAPIANFFCNNIHQFHLVRRIAPHFNVCLVPEAEAMARYREVGAEPVFFPMAANPDRYRPMDVPVRYDATFAGQRYADRASSILALREAGVDAHAFGQGWEVGAEVVGAAGTPAHAAPSGPGFGTLGRAAALVLQGKSPFRAATDVRDWARLSAAYGSALHGPVSDDAYIALFSESRISLGFLVLGDTHRQRRPLRQVRLREFEAPMSGAFYMTEWLEEVALHYDVGKEIVCYRSRAELVDRCRYYLAHDAERERIRLAGRARALRDHTWKRRFEDLFGEVRRRGLITQI